MEEIWKDVPGYEGRYMVSTYGRVKSVQVWVGNKYSKKYAECNWIHLEIRKRVIL